MRGPCAVRVALRYTFGLPHGDLLRLGSVLLNFYKQRSVDTALHDRLGGEEFLVPSRWAWPNGATQCSTRVTCWTQPTGGCTKVSTKAVIGSGG